MAGRKKGGEKGGTPTLDNDFSADDAQEFFDKLAEISNRMKEDAAGGRGDMNAVYDAMVAKLGVDKESAKFLWNRHSAEERFRERAKKLDTASRKSLERFASQMEGTPFGDFATMALEDAGDGKASVKSSKKKDEPEKAEAEKVKADA
jgi:hypothetical protein